MSGRLGTYEILWGTDEITLELGTVPNGAIETHVYRDHSIGVVVPAYNEQGFVGRVIDTMPAFVDRIYVVDDCSTDGTWAEIEAYAATVNGTRTESTVVRDGDRTANETVVSDGGVGDRVVPIRHETNRGVGGAIKTGYLRAHADGIDVTAVMAGDGQMDPEQLHRLVDPIVEDEADYAKGNRLLYQEYREGMTRWRFFGNSVLTFLTKIASGYWKSMDPQNGYTAISYRALDNVGLDDMYEYYGYCNDLLVKLNAKGMRVADVAIPAVYGEEKSTINYSRYIRRVSVMLLGNFLWRLKTKYLVFDFHPLALFYLFGAIGSLVGIAGVIYTIVGHLAGIVTGPAFIHGILSLIVFTLGSLFVLFAMLFDMQNSESLEVSIRE